MLSERLLTAVPIHLALGLLLHALLEVWIAAQQASRYALLACSRCIHLLYAVECL